MIIIMPSWTFSQNKHCFDSIQLQQIHQKLLEGEYYKCLTDSLVQVIDTKEKIHKTDSLILVNQSNTIVNLKLTKDSDNRTIELLKQDIGLLEKQMKRKKLWSRCKDVIIGVLGIKILIG